MSRWFILIFAVAVTLWSSVVVIDERETAIVTQFGAYKRALGRPGLHFKTPFVQDVTRMDARIQLNDASPTEYLTVDKKRLLADGRPVGAFHVEGFWLGLETVSRFEEAMQELQLVSGDVLGSGGQR